MPHLSFDLDLLSALPNISRASGVPAETLAYGLLQMWAYCWRERVVLLGPVHVAGFFGGDHEKVCDALQAFGVVEKVDDGYRVRGAEKWLRILEAQRKAAEGTNKCRWSDGPAMVERRSSDGIPTDSDAGATVERRSTGRSEVGTSPLSPPDPLSPPPSIDHLRKEDRPPKASGATKGKSKIAFIEVDPTSSNGLRDPEKIRRWGYLCWQRKYNAHYPQEPFADNEIAVGLLNYHRLNKLSGGWEAWVQEIIETYYRLDDDWLEERKYSFKFLGGKMTQILASMGGSSASARPY